MRRENPLEPLEPDVRDAMEVERAALDGPDDAKARVLDRVATTIGLLSASMVTGSAPSAHAALRNPAAARAWRWASPWWHIASFALGSIAGVVGWRATQTPPPPRIVYVDRAPPAPSVPTSMPTMQPVAEPSASLSPQPMPPRGSVSTSAGDSLSAERALLDAARSAFGRGEPGEAMAALARHEKLFPSGQLAEEREALAVRSLVLAGHADEARARAARFRKRYPTSVMLPAVEASLDAPP